MIKILIGLLVLSVMVVIHELGHFLMAKLCGVTVESFSIGWGPILLKKKIKETEYRIEDIESWIKNGKIKKQKEGSVDCIDKLGEIKNNIEKY